MELFIPRTVEELEAAVSAGAIDETAYLDFKQTLSMTKGGRKDVAKDVAAFSVDGGVIIFGVSEPAAGSFELAPQALSGWREWIDQVALHGVQPSVRVTTTALTREDGTGYMVVVVPPSPRAPHMVDGRYWRRSDNTNTQLTDGEVRDLWRRNLDRRADGLALVRAEIDRDPTPDGLRTGARLFIAAQPVSADPRLLLESVPGRNLRHWVDHLVKAPVMQRRRIHSPSLSECTSVSLRAHGVARSSYEVGPDRRVRDNGTLAATVGSIIDYEIREDGGVRVLYGRASDILRGEPYLMLECIIGELASVVELVREISSASGFNGSWTLGVGLVGLQSLPAFNVSFVSTSASFSEDSYEEAAEVASTDLDAAGSPILEALLGRLARSLDQARSPLSESDVFARDSG